MRSQPIFPPSAMDTPALVLYVLVPIIDKRACISTQQLALRYVQPPVPRPYICLHERPQDAVDRVRYLLGSQGAHAAFEASRAHAVSEASHAVLRVIFSLAGFAHYALQVGQGRHAFAPILVKKLFASDPSYDWKQWLFYGDLPLQLDSLGDDAPELIRTEWASWDALCLH